ncbi:EF-hand domain pair [Phytophthora infestans]|uniref:EF-hand domain pair n=1 Tax=Phytophthora infestans TaxID=4787 RepID=A0A8S9V6C2_PHYIN|nr:EF-hand domain pair [Phytophthora infestans]
MATADSSVAAAQGAPEITFEAFCKWCSARIQESHYSKEKLVEEIFRLVDADGGRIISMVEFVSIFKTLGQALDYDDGREVVSQMDRNGDGKIDLEEFLTQSKIYTKDGAFFTCHGI